MIGQLVASCTTCGPYGFRGREDRASWAIDHKHSKGHSIHIESEIRR